MNNNIAGNMSHALPVKTLCYAVKIEESERTIVRASGCSMVIAQW